jgi:hypothetical protein
MNTNLPENTPVNNFLNAVAVVKSKLGKELLTDKDILLLAVDAIANSCTFAEKGYGFGEPANR